MKQDKFKRFINENREQFDELQPDARIWSEIEKNMVATGLFSSSLGKVGLLAKAPAAKALLVGAIGAGLMGGAALYYIAGSNRGNLRAVQTTQTAIYSTSNSAPPKGQNTNNITSNSSLAPAEIEPDDSALSAPPPPSTAIAPTTADPAPASHPLSSTTTAVMAPNAAQNGRYYRAMWSADGGDVTLNIDTLIRDINYVTISSNGLNWLVEGNNSNNVAINAGVSVKPEGKKSGDYSVRITCTVNGDTLNIRGVFTTKRNWFNMHRQSLVSITMPRQASLVASEECGNMAISNLAGKTCRITTEDGNIRARQLMSAATLATTTGNVTIDTSEGRLNIQTRLGNVRVANSRGSLNATTNTGNIMLKLFSGNAITISGTGNANLDGCNGKFNITTNTGNCRLSDCSGQWDILTERGNLRADNLLLTGNASITTATGNVKVDIANPADEVSFDVHSANGNITITSAGNIVKGNGSVQAGNGKFKITSTVTTGNQDFICN